MAITTYAELQTAIADWLARPGDTTIATIAPDFVRLCEDMFNYGYGVEGEQLYMPPLRTRDMETRATQIADTEYVSVPEDFLELRSIKINDNPEVGLSYSSPQQFAEAASSQTSGTPKTYTIIDGSLRFGPSPASSTVELIYYAKIPALTASNTANWLLTKVPSAYLYGSLFHSSIYTGNPQDEARGQVWFNMCAAQVKALQQQDRRSKYGGAPLVMRPVTATP